MSRSRARLLGLILLVIGIITPMAIDAWETRCRLDISREIGVAPWLALAAIGVALLLYSAIAKR